MDSTHKDTTLLTLLYPVGSEDKEELLGCDVATMRGENGQA
jgi:hypothetical protein